MSKRTASYESPRDACRKDIARVLEMVKAKYGKETTYNALVDHLIETVGYWSSGRRTTFRRGDGAGVIVEQPKPEGGAT